MADNVETASDTADTEVVAPKPEKQKSVQNSVVKKLR